MASRHEAPANFKSFEAIATAGGSTLDFGSSIVRFMATNDDPIKTVSIKLKQDWLSLGPKETISLPFRASSVEVSADNASYRIWGYW